MELELVPLQIRADQSADVLRAAGGESGKTSTAACVASGTTLRHQQVS